ncbi:MAG TPA: hypothetical protein PLI99_01645, partial [archaeon]|nr:hypothetical protein [archaeon]
MSYKKIILISFFLLLLMSGVLSLVVSPSEIQLMADASNGMSMGTSYSYNVKMALQRFWSGQGYNNTAINSSSLNGTGYNTFLKDMASRKGWSIPNDTKSYKQIEQRLFDSFKKPAPAPGMTDVQP